ncbi:hypothetical protein HD806DRAFT_531451 [Xylariaceae sp. AK1471]|nr:hypothetical protein HD806DRAFT_531451 [Xylariaceae sp. AK1471]
MATQLTVPAQQRSIHIPDELVLMVFSHLPGYHWPEIWCTWRAVSRMWKIEIEKCFAQKYLPHMTLTLFDGRCTYCHGDRLKTICPGHLFKYVNEESPTGRAVFQHQDICNRTGCRKGGAVDSLKRAADGRPSQYVISLPEFLVANDTEIEDLQIDGDSQKISFLWLPTVKELFREEVQLRKLSRAAAEEAIEKARAAAERAGFSDHITTKKEMMLYILQKDTEHVSLILSKVRCRLIASGGRVLHTPLMRANLRYPKEYLFWSW